MVFVAEKLGVPSWPVFFGWSIFFFTGADLNACKKSLPPIILGPILGYLTVTAQSTLGTSGITSALIVVVLGFTMTIAQSFSLFEVAAATFVSCSVYFASGNLFYSIVLTASGLVLGIITIKLSDLINSVIYNDISSKEKLVQ